MKKEMVSDKCLDKNEMERESIDDVLKERKKQLFRPINQQ